MRGDGQTFAANVDKAEASADQQIGRLSSGPLKAWTRPGSFCELTSDGATS